MKLAKEEREIIILSILVGALILVGYFYCFLRPKARTLARLSPEVARLKRDLKEANSLIVNVDNFKAEIFSLKAEVGDYEARLPSEKEIAGLLDYLSKVARTTGVKIIEIKELKGPTREERPGQVYDEVLIGMSMRAGYHQLGRFVNRVETSTRLMKVHDLEIKADPKSPMEHNIKLIVGAFILEKE